eukprot:m.118566 g.118566  ORF g.118566 m.118566 type:complete len:1915 (+) comp9344_c0_seq1:274-6018(+)
MLLPRRVGGGGILTNHISISSFIHRCQQQKRGSLASLATTRWVSSFSKSTQTKNEEHSVAEVVDIGGVSTKVRTSNAPWFVPKNYTQYSQNDQASLSIVQWLFKKDLLKQDVFLIGPPGSYRRRLALGFCEMVNKEVEYIALTRDTTEADLKQRRELRNGSAIYEDQCAVRAALMGKVLVLDGIEKAERNLLPILNNILENREMHLEDGRFLVAPERYDNLLKQFSKQELERLHLVRVHEDFQVIALGLPVPPMRGNPLDPPLRSRFQSKSIPTPPLSSILSDQSNKAFKFAATLNTMTLAAKDHPKIADVPQPHPMSDHGLQLVEHLSKIAPGLDSGFLISSAFPFRFSMSEKQQDIVRKLMQRFEITTSPLQLEGPSKPSNTPFWKLQRKEIGATNTNFVGTMQCNQWIFQAPVGSAISHNPSHNIVPVPYQEHVQAQLGLLHSFGDVCILGSTGCGKSVVVEAFARTLGYNTTHVMLHKDLTARDLLQQRITLVNGDTSWRLSPLLAAAKEGHLVVLDGLHRLNDTTTSALQRLCQDREIDLFNGTKFVESSRFDALMMNGNNSITEKELNANGVFRIHPSFRIIATAEPPKPSQAGLSSSWLSNEIQAMFSFLPLRPLNHIEEEAIISGLFPSIPIAERKRIISLIEHIRDQSLVGSEVTLTTRHAVRIANRLEKFPDSEDLPMVIKKTLMADLLPSMTQVALNTMFAHASLAPSTTVSQKEEVCLTTSFHNENGRLFSGNVSLPIMPLSSSTRAKVPETVFYNNPQHMKIIQDIMKDFAIGEHVLIAGNQGVGKNKIVDHLLQQLQYPREYMQLHRDSTIQSLSQQPTVVDGQLSYHDSPLVRAVEQGSVLVIDEADKAPIHVTSVLKTLVENGEMALADGRRIVPHDFESTLEKDKVLRTHPDFRMVFLANRPGFPFLGNNFYASMGDLFSCHVVNNPDLQAEVDMLKKYAPSTPESMLRKLSASFQDLRNYMQSGKLTYPYSMREIVSIARHLETYPGDGVAIALQNVFDFDAFEPDKLNMVHQTLRRHGIPTTPNSTFVRLPSPIPLKPAHLHTTLHATPLSSEQPYFSTDQVALEPLFSSVVGKKKVETMSSNFTDPRWHSFTNEELLLRLPLHHGEKVQSITQSPSGEVLAISDSPSSLYVISEDRFTVNHIPLDGIITTDTEVVGRSDGHAFLFNKVSGGIVKVDTKSGKVWQLATTTNRLQYYTREAFRRMKNGADHKSSKEIISLPGSHNRQQLIQFGVGGTTFSIIDVVSETFAEVSLHAANSSIGIVNILPFGTDGILVQLNDASTPTSSNNHNILIRAMFKEEGKVWSIVNQQNIASSSVSIPKGLFSIATKLPIPPTMVEAILPEMTSIAKDVKWDAVWVCPSSHNFEANEAMSLLMVVPGMEKNEWKVFQLASPFKNTDEDVSRDAFHAIPSRSGRTLTLLSRHSPSERNDQLGKMDVLDVANNVAYRIGIDRFPWDDSTRPLLHPVIVHASAVGDAIVTIDSEGTMKWFAVDSALLNAQLSEWERVVGMGQGVSDTGNTPLRVQYSRHSGLDVSSPKHGKVDPNNAPHVGGNTWAGGTGGRDTAGLGGKGGPYRLDACHDIHQLSDEEKENIPEDVKRAAREMGREAFKEKLQEIDMSEHDADIYYRYVSAVQSEIQSLKNQLSTLKTKGKERQWLKNQSMGDIDDCKLVDGMVGDQSIYKRRGEDEVNPFATPQHPKLVRIVVDVSASMYRFNSFDQRMHRQLETTCMMMEALGNGEHNIEWELVGHSGDSEYIPFVRRGQPPKNEAERLKILQTMVAHSQYCFSGDSTLQAVGRSVMEMSALENVDQKLLVVLSDANFQRYGIYPEDFGRILTSSDDVDAFAIMIGTFQHGGWVEADEILRSMPPGRGHVCLDTSQLPQIMQQIFIMSLNNQQ